MYVSFRFMKRFKDSQVFDDPCGFNSPHSKQVNLFHYFGLTSLICLFSRLFTEGSSTPLHGRVCDDVLVVVCVTVVNVYPSLQQRGSSENTTPPVVFRYIQEDLAVRGVYILENPCDLQTRRIMGIWGSDFRFKICQNCTVN